MTLNVTVTSPRFLISCSDRRLTNSLTGGIVTEQSTKLTQLVCKNALTLISYNGIGKWDGKTPSDWLLDLNHKVQLTALTLIDVLEAVREECDRRIAMLPKAVERRFTFVFGVWGHSSVYIISNYESATSEAILAKARDRFEISFSRELQYIRIIVTGSTQCVNVADMEKIVQVGKKAGAHTVDVKNLCVRLIQNAWRKNRGRGPVGSGVLWAFKDRGAMGVQGGFDVPGGSRIHVGPNLIIPGMQLSDIRSESGAKPLSLGKGRVLPEQKCIRCKNPVPLGYKQCGVCGEPVTLSGMKT